MRLLPSAHQMLLHPLFARLASQALDENHQRVQQSSPLCRVGPSTYHSPCFESWIMVTFIIYLRAFSDCCNVPIRLNTWSKTPYSRSDTWIYLTQILASSKLGLIEKLLNFLNIACIQPDTGLRPEDCTPALQGFATKLGFGCHG